jgi:hypothetical protein
LDTDVAFLLPADPGIQRVQLLLDVKSDTNVEVEVWDTGKPENYIPITLQAHDVRAVKPGKNQWVEFELPWNPEHAQNAFVIIKENPEIGLHLSHQPMTGTLTFVKEKSLNAARGMESLNHEQPVVKWNMRRVVRKPVCFRLMNETLAFSPDKIINGYQRPYGGPNMWLSEKMANEQWIELSWADNVKFNEIHVTFNDDVNEDLINLHHHRTEFDIIPELVKKYRLEAFDNGSWRQVCGGDDNRQRKVKHCLDITVETDRLRLVVEQTNGTDFAEVVEIRVRNMHSQ